MKKVVRAAAKQLERKIILETLEAHHWNRRTVARALNISYAGLLIKMREAGIGPARGPSTHRGRKIAVDKKMMGAPEARRRPAGAPSL